MDTSNNTFLTPNKTTTDRKRKGSDVFEEDFAGVKRFRADDSEERDLDRWNQRRSPSPRKQVDIPQLSEVKYSKKLQKILIYSNLGANACVRRNFVREKYFFHGISRNR